MNLADATQACKRELAALFAHVTYESGDRSGDVETEGGARFELTGLMYSHESECAEAAVHECMYRLGKETGLGRFFPPYSSVSYRGRGPIQLRWNYRYG